MSLIPKPTQTSPKQRGLIVSQHSFTGLSSYPALQNVPISTLNLAVAECAAGYQVVVVADFSLDEIRRGDFDTPNNPNLPAHIRRLAQAAIYQQKRRLFWYKGETRDVANGLALLKSLDGQGTSLKAPPSDTDQLLVYLMSHGLQGKVLFGDSVQIDAKDPMSVSGALSLPQLRPLVKDWKRVLVVLDCCQSGVGQHAHAPASSLQHGKFSDLPVQLSGDPCFQLLTSTVYDEQSWSYPHHSTLLQIAMREVFFNASAFLGDWAAVGALTALATDKMTEHCAEPPACLPIRQVGCRLARFDGSWGASNTGNYVFFKPMPDTSTEIEAYLLLHGKNRFVSVVVDSRVSETDLRAYLKLAHISPQRSVRDWPSTI